VPLAPPALFPSQLDDEAQDEELVGVHQGRFFVRDAHDTFRLYPGIRLRNDLHAAIGAPDVPATEGGRALQTSLLVRRVRLELSGEIMERIAFTGGVELGGGRIGATRYSGPTTERFVPPNAADGAVRPAEVTVSYRLRKWLGVTLGQQNMPFSLSNRTREFATPLTERTIGIRGFAVPHEQDLGLTVWGDLPNGMLSYEVGVFGGDGPEQAFADGNADFAGRIYSRPLASLGKSTFFERAQIGVSARHGERDQQFVDADYPNLATAQGTVMWQPGYVDGFDRVTRVMGSGAQNAIGGELRLPFDLPWGRAIEARGELYYQVNNTREAIEGFELTNTERFGRMKGLAWYGLVSFWLAGDPFAYGHPGIYRPYHVDLDKPAPPTLRGLELVAVAGGVNANYNGATREGSVPDANTPSSDIDVFQFGGALQYWYGHNFRATVEYMAYLAPDSDDPTQNAARVPDNLVTDVNGVPGDGNVHHELSARLGITF
jgi:hypothetical protein